MTSLRILGPIEAWSGDERLAIGGPRQLALLACLVLRANRAVSIDVLSDAVWGPSRAKADNRLQMAVARLRKALEPLSASGAVRLTTVKGGYLLELRSGELDAQVFEELVQTGRSALEEGAAVRATELVAEALSLWRGTPLAEVAFADFALAEIRRLEELRLLGITVRLEGELVLGHHAQVIGELEAGVIEEPTSERLVGLLMLALYRCGRQAEALDAYQQIRVKLAEDFGLEPGLALQALQKQILDQAPLLVPDTSGATIRSPEPPRLTRPDSARQLGAPLPSRLQPYGPSAFINREAERRSLTAALAEAGTAGRAAAFVTGEPGIGKTRLVSEIALEAHRSGALVVGGRCDEGLGLPYQPFVEALEHLIAHAPRELLDAHVNEYGDSVGRLVPALTTRAGAAATIAGEPSESERYALFRAIEGLLVSASAGGRLLLVLEDLHWADGQTLQLLRRLLTSPRSPPLLILSTSRITELSDDHPLRALLADLHRERRVQRFDLGGLRTSEVGELLRELAGDPRERVDDGLTRALKDSTNGNPFFITEIVRSLTETGALINDDGHWQLAEGVEVADQMPLSISETLAKRLRAMGEPVRDCLRIASVIGVEFEPRLVSEVFADGAVDALDAAVDGGVLIEVPGAWGRLRFSHALMQRYLYSELSGRRRSEIHKRVAIALEERTEPEDRPVAELATHWLGAGQAESPKALEYTSAAGDEALEKLAPDEARRWYQMSIQLLAQQPGKHDPALCDLLIRRGEAERQAGDLAFRGTLLEAAELARQIGDDERLVRAVLANTRGMQSETGIVDQTRIDTIEAALRLVHGGDSAARARLLAMHAAELMYSGDWQRRVRISDEALAMARRVADSDALSAVLNMRFVTLLAPETLAERSANALEAVELAERLRDPLLRFYAYHWCAYACIEGGDIERARAWAGQEREIADRYRQPTTIWLSRADEANLAIVAGELEIAANLAGTALQIGSQSERDAMACFAAQQTSIAFESGMLAELVPLLEQAVQANPGVPGFRATLALALLGAARHEEAGALLLEAARTSFAEVPYDVTWLTVICIYGYVSVQLESMPAARAIYELLRPWHDQVAFPAFGVWGPVALFLGSLASLVGEAEAARRHLAEAVELAKRSGAPLWQARATAELARLA